MNFGMIKRRLRYQHKASALAYVLRNPSLLFSISQNPSKFYFSKTLEGILKGNIVSCLHNFLPDKFVKHLKERSYVPREGIPLILYLVVRAYKPEIVVETGVAQGASSAFILCSLHENNMGHLYSIDLPPYDASIKSKDAARGMITLKDGQKLLKDYSVAELVPGYLKERWTLVYGDSRTELPALLRKIGKISIFFHDSLHTYDHMLFEYETAWPYIEKNGFLLSHDILWNKAFLDFSKKVNLRPLIYYGFGAIQK